MPSLHRLRVAARNELTSDSVALHLLVPPDLRKAYRFREGQFLTLQAQIGDEILRRPYSICTAVQDYESGGELRVGIRRIAKGRFSTWAKTVLKAGDSIEVMTPDGRFTPPILSDHDNPPRSEAATSQGRHHLAFAGGSGITPIMAILKTRLRDEPQSRFTLIYGNRHSQSVMFLEELEDLKNTFLERLHLIHILSEERTQVELHQGLLDPGKCRLLLNQLINPKSIDVAYICGPEPMMLAAEAALRDAGVDPRRILIERFSAAPQAAPTAPRSVQAGFTNAGRSGMESGLAWASESGSGLGSGAGSVSEPASEPGSASTVRITIDGKERSVVVDAQGTTILQAGLQAGMPLPYACQAGVCCTCRARVTQGEVRMDRNFSLEESELEQGFVLTCQARPLSPGVSLSYDER